MDDEVVTGFLKTGTIKNNSEKRAILDQRKNNTPNVARRANEVSDKNNINTSNNTGNRVRFWVYLDAAIILTLMLNLSNKRMISGWE